MNHFGNQRLTIGSPIYIVNMANFLIRFQYAKAFCPLRGEQFVIVLFLFFFRLVKANIYLNSISHVSWGAAITVKDWLWCGGELHSEPRGHGIHPWRGGCCCGDGDGPEGQSVQTADSVQQSEKRKDLIKSSRT